jgi:ribonucleoside-diphosphate reductase alpha chain
VATGSEAGADFGPLFAKSPALGPQRAPLPPEEAPGFTQEARIGGHKVFLRTGEYEDGQLGEIFIDMHKEGAAFRSLMNCFAIAVSMGLQHGVPLARVRRAVHVHPLRAAGRGEGHANVKFATSIIDYVFRVLGIEYLQRYDLAHVPPDGGRGHHHRPAMNSAPSMTPLAHRQPSSPPMAATATAAARSTSSSAR